MWEPKRALFEDQDGEIIWSAKVREISNRINGSKQVITSRDFEISKDLLVVADLPKGFFQSQIPFIFEAESPLFLTTANADAFFPEHVHSKASVFRLIVFGSIIVEGYELKVGDWMFVPCGVSYWLKAGASGATIVHKYGTPPCRGNL